MEVDPKLDDGSFARPDVVFANLDGTLVGQIVAASADVALVVEADGLIVDMAFAGGRHDSPSDRDWVGRNFADIVTGECLPKVDVMLSEAGRGRYPRWYEINHPAGSGPDVPVRYMVVPLGRDGQAIFLGHDLGRLASLQRRIVDVELSVEREYARARGIEMQSHALMETAPDAVVIAEADTMRVTGVNTTAAKLLEIEAETAPFGVLGDFFVEADGAALKSAVKETLTSGRTGGATLSLKRSGREIAIRMSLVRRDGASHLVLRMSPPDRPADGSDVRELDEVLSQFTEALVVTDAKFNVIAVNNAFLDLSGIPGRSQVKGLALDFLVGEHELDVSVLTSTLKSHKSVKQFATVLKGWWRGSNRNVVVSAGRAVTGGNETFGFIFKPAEATTRRRAGNVRVLRPANEMIDLVGRVPLKDIVRETTDIVERLCVEAALETTRQNRASAAELLGLSRQGLYSKLNRYGMAGSIQDDE